jgi:hypothetical protein
VSFEDSASDAGCALAVVSGSFLRRCVAVADVVSRYLLSQQHELNPELAIAMPAPRTNNLTPDLILVEPDLAIGVVIHHVTKSAQRAPSVLLPTRVERVRDSALTPLSLARPSSTHISSSRHVAPTLMYP